MNEGTTRSRQMRLHRHDELDNLTAEEARRRWDYDPDTGILRWKVNINSRAKVGNVAGSFNSVHGYVNIGIDNKLYPVHRVIWLIVYGEWPSGQIDHINGIQTDNRVQNLRNVSTRQNQQNGKRHRAGHLPGTTRRTRNLKTPWQAQIQIDGKKKFLGCFATQQEAHERYMQEVAKMERS